jgi:hypothetical protein
VVDDLNDGRELARRGTVVEENNAADLDVALEGADRRRRGGHTDNVDKEEGREGVKVSSDALQLRLESLRPLPDRSRPTSLGSPGQLTAGT